MESKTETEVIRLIKDLQQKVIYLERKINILIAQSKPPSFYEAPKRFEKSERGSFKKKDARAGRPFEKKASDEGKWYSNIKKPPRPNVGRKYPDKPYKKKGPGAL